MNIAPDTWQPKGLDLSQSNRLLRASPSPKPPRSSCENIFTVGVYSIDGKYLTTIRTILKANFRASTWTKNLVRLRKSNPKICGNGHHLRIFNAWSHDKREDFYIDFNNIFYFAPLPVLKNKTPKKKERYNVFLSYIRTQLHLIWHKKTELWYRPKLAYCPS